MSYIKESKENPFTLWDFSFSNNTKFSIHSNNNDCDYKCFHILLVNSHCDDNGCTEVEVIVWAPNEGCGRHTISIEEVSSKIDMKQLLIEIAKTFGKTDFEENYCYIEVKSEKMNFTF